MVYRDRQGLSSPSDPIQSSNNRDRYLDNCFLLCLNRNDETDVPEIHRLENNIMRDLCNNNPLNKIKSQQQSRRYLQEQISENYDYDDDDLISPRQQRDRDNTYRRKEDYYPDSQTRSRYQRDDGTDSYYTHNQYSRTGRFNHRDDYNIMQHSDDELSVYEVYVPTNTLNRLSDKRIDNNMVLIDYEDVSMLRDTKGSSSSYGYQSKYPPRNKPLNQYGNYGPQYQYDPSTSYPRERDGQQQYYQNNPIEPQQRFGGYYGNEGDRHLYSPQSGPFLPTNPINVRRHIYSPSQLPQGLTEGQLVMLLQKGSQYHQEKPMTGPPTQLFPTQTEAQPSTTSAVTVSHQASSSPSTYIEPIKTPEFVPPTQIKIPQVPPQIIDHRLVDDDKKSVSDELTKPMSTLKPSDDIESKDKKKDKTSDVKKDKKGEKEASSNKKDGKKEKSSGKDGKKKKK